ncbi:succinate dehydrogenase, cytochrome b556 subunit [Pantoea sp. Mhis]|uniref:succinate dehydrogenase, cytochrome b556 subunit n=1 Tax=Pantoea sp. Mhis TaxID=2576759 RepID=UPI00135936CC|nr:succinate dehydrogenase, cytochrome b556 subunit [Pantoea sp. Mhis]MXP56282.1 succinate dehydrogenase, cytochrome b556 subunit [Pantoea sp. Mhis]
MKTHRPVNLNLIKFHFPITAISSIFHRISGIIIFIMLGIALWLLDLSLSSAEGFMQVVSIMDSFFARFVKWIMLTLLTYHVISGIRYVLMDFGYLAENLAAGIRSTKIVFFITIVISILVGFAIW